MSRADRIVTGALDAVLVFALVAVPLAFSTSLRSFDALKIPVLELLVGAAAVLAAFAPHRVGAATKALGLAALGLVGAVALRPDADGLAGAGYLLACALLASLATDRLPHWPRRRLLIAIGLPLAIGLAYSLAQSVGLGVLTATAAAFGTTHGVAVGTVGNPTENTWYLLLATCLFAGVVRDRRAWWLWVAVAAVIVVDRSRAAAVVGAAVLCWRVVEHSGGVRRLVAAGGWARWAAPAALAGGVLLAVSWGGAEALHGRAYLVTITLGMIARSGGIPQGPGAFARDFPSAQAETLEAAPHLAPFQSTLQHAHCDLLELAYNYGFPALVVFALAAALVVRTVRQDPTQLRRAAAATLVVATSLGVFGYPLFSPASAVVIAVAFALAVAPSRVAPPRRLLALAPFGIALMVLGIHQLRSERELTKAMQAHADGDDAQALIHARRAAAQFPSTLARQAVEQIQERQP